MTGDPLVHRLIRDYLKDLENEAAVLPAQTRRDLLTEIRGHLREALNEGTSGEADVRNLLDGLGDPRKIVAAARSDSGEALVVARAGLREAAAILLLLFGGILLPVLGWFVGVALMWSSNAWTSGHKLLGTLVIPGGLLAPALLLSLQTGWTLPPWVGVPLLIVLVVAPIMVTVRLWRTACRSV